MLMVEAGELAFDALVNDHLPEDLRFDTNEASTRRLLGHRSGIPDYHDLPASTQQTDPNDGLVLRVGQGPVTVNLDGPEAG
jgi:CubicO group peptidase (beta-lactamase class C family)